MAGTVRAVNVRVVAATGALGVATAEVANRVRAGSVDLPDAFAAPEPEDAGDRLVSG